MRALIIVALLLLSALCIDAYSYASTNQQGRRYLVQNSKKSNVIVTESGLQYRILSSSGSKNHPSRSDQVRVHYHGTLVDGTVFDSSVQRGDPATFGVSQVISGWTEALMLMSVGDKWELTIPAHLAYGKRGAGGKIGPDSALIFEVELLGIVGNEAEEL
jgi:FKBP-type peptidyl-prolyl cis-trans isomerase